MSDEKLILTSPVSGRAAALGEAPDSFFASGLMGSGAVLYPREGVLRAPCDGVVAYVLPRKYALSLKAEGGLELLMQVGIDTRCMDGIGFCPLVEPGSRVHRGQELAHFDLPTLERAGAQTATPVVVNLPASQVHPLTTGDLNAGQALLELTL